MSLSFLSLPRRKLIPRIDLRPDELVFSFSSSGGGA